MTLVGASFSRNLVHLFLISCDICGDLYKWNSMQDLPTSCPVDATHTLTSVCVARTELRDYVEDASVRIVEDSSMFDTARNFQIQGHTVSCPGSSTTTYSFNYPVNASVSCVTMPISTDNEGSVFSCYLPTGPIAATAVSVGDTQVGVSLPVAAAISKGAELYVSVDGAAEQTLGRVVSVEVTSGTPLLFFQNPVEAAGTGVFSARFYVAKDLTLRTCGGPLVIGNSKVGGSAVPAGQDVVCEYTNASSSEVTLTFYVEYTY